MLIDKENITSYIPQRAPFVMIDELLEASVEGFESRFEVVRNNPLIVGDELSESAVVENIAQTCAAGFGYLGAQEEQGSPKIGFIGAISKLEVFANPKLGDVVHTSVKIISSFENIHLIEGVSSSKGNELSRCQMKIFQG
jgi:predicted hotdog family 3-hydroxylacyl-ACP dehydratase